MYKKLTESSWLKYTLRYVPLLILALLLIPLRGYFAPHPQVGTSALASPTSSAPFLQSEQALYDVAMLSTREGWAVGGAFNDRFDSLGHLLDVEPDHGLIWHYVAGSWFAFTVTAQPLLSLSMISSHAGWAVGYAGTLLYYDGQTWQNVSSPTQTILRAVTALSEKDAWAVGFGGLILHYNGTCWQALPSPVHADLRSIFMLSSDDGWIAGDGGLLLHYHNHIWQRVTSPTSEKLNRVTMLSANEGWAVGANGTILHYHSGIWNAVRFINNNETGSSGTSTDQGMPAFYDIAMISIRSGWIIGGASLLSYDREVWSNAQNTMQTSSRYSSPLIQDTALYSLTMFSEREGWAIGQIGTAILFLHYRDGAWYEYA